MVALACGATPCFLVAAGDSNFDGWAVGVPAGSPVGASDTVMGWGGW